MSNPIKFGTDGWRAVIAEDFTFDNVRAVAQATADYWAANLIPGCAKQVVIGYDRRFLSDEFASASAEVFSGNGFKVILTDCPTPTPAVSYTVLATKSIGGVMITASHNPAKFNGFKLKAHFGGPADSSTCSEIEKVLAGNIAVNRKPLRGSANISVQDIKPAYFEAIKAQVDMKLIAASGLRFAHDALFGVGAGCFDEMLKGTTCKVTTINGQHDPLFGGINPEPIEKNYRLGSAYLKQHPHDFCLVTDGDSDRIGAMDGNGNYLSAHEIICLVLRHLVVNRKRSGAMIKAISTTAMVDAMCAAYNIPVKEVCIGFKNVVPEIVKPDALMAGEESGSLGFAGHIPERDGLLAGLFILEMLAMEKRPVTEILAELNAQFGKREYRRIDAHFPLELRDQLLAKFKTAAPESIQGVKLVRVNLLDGVKYLLADDSWLLIRGSGTEPIIRLYAEGRTTANVEALLTFAQNVAEEVKTSGTT